MSSNDRVRELPGRCFFNLKTSEPMRPAGSIPPSPFRKSAIAKLAEHLSTPEEYLEMERAAEFKSEYLSVTLEALGSRLRLADVYEEVPLEAVNEAGADTA